MHGSEVSAWESRGDVGLHTCSIDIQARGSVHRYRPKGQSQTGMKEPIVRLESCTSVFNMQRRSRSDEERKAVSAPTFGEEAKKHYCNISPVGPWRASGTDIQMYWSFSRCWRTAPCYCCWKTPRSIQNNDQSWS